MMEMVRNAVFNMVMSLYGCSSALPETTRWLDLFAGTGAVGIEALSRGCGECHFVEMRCIACCCCCGARKGGRGGPAAPGSVPPACCCPPTLLLQRPRSHAATLLRSPPAAPGWSPTASCPTWRPASWRARRWCTPGCAHAGAAGSSGSAGACAGRQHVREGLALGAPGQPPLIPPPPRPSTSPEQKAEDFLRRASQLSRFAGGPFDFLSGAAARSV